MIDRNLIILFVVCVVFMVYLGIEGFAAYTSYSQMLAAKYGTLKVTSGSKDEKIESIMTDDELNAKYKGMGLSGSELANAVKAAKEWQSYNASPNADLYKKLAAGATTLKDIREIIGTGDDGRPQNKKWLTYYDATNYDPDSPDIVKTASGSFLQKRTGSRWNETSYIDTVYFNEDTKRADGKTLNQCKSDDFNCIRHLTYADPNYQPYQGDSSWQSQFGGGGFQTTNTGFPIAPSLPPAPPTPVPPAAGSQTPIDNQITKIVDCIKNCQNKVDVGLCSLNCAINTTA